MKIVVNTRLLIKNQLSGIGWFKYHVLKRLVREHSDHTFVFLFDRKFDEEFIFGPNVIPEVIFPPARHPVLWYLWFQSSIVRAIHKHDPDLFFSPDGYLSTRIKNIPSVPVIHDINFQHKKRDVPFFDGLFWRYYFPKYAKMASRIITVSEFSKKDIMSTYRIPADKIDVAYNGAGEDFIPLNDKLKLQVKINYTHGEDYFIYVGALVPRKNLEGMILAFDRYKEGSGSKNKLIIVGDRLFFTSEMNRVYMNAKYKNDIIFTGRVEQEQLVQLVGGALGLLLVSYFEGFGVPVIEAMSADVPVITSNTSSLPEIANDAALLVDPYSVGSIADAMMKISNDEQLRLALIKKGKIQRKYFSWDKTAAVIWNCFEKVMDNSKNS